MAIIASVTALVVAGSSDPVEASGLRAFTSCAEMRSWAEDSMARGGSSGDVVFEPVGGEIVEDRSVATTGAPMAGDDGDAGSQAGAGESADEGATNVVVEGVDELDLVDRLDDDRVLVASGSRLALVDLTAGEVLASRAISFDTQISYDADRAVAWLVGHGDGGIEVARVRVGDASLTDEGAWSTSGTLVAARRIAGEMHVVATEGFYAIAEGDVPFGGDPVPCDQVLHPVGPSDPSATLLVTLPAGGPLEPVESTEVAGAGNLVHVTTSAAYLATPQWGDDGSASTLIHRFELDSLTHTGSGRVEGTLLNDFSMSEHDGHLRVATTQGGGGFIGRPMPVEGDGGIGGSIEPMPAPDEPVSDDVATDEVVTDDGGSVGAPIGSQPTVVPGSVDGGGTDGSTGSSAGGDVAATERTAPPLTSVPEPTPNPSTPTTSSPDATVPDTTVPPVTEPQPTAPQPTVPEPSEPEPTEPPIMTIAPEPLPEPEPEPGEALNQVVVLDTDGDLDVVGRTAMFGHPGETLHGIRFVGDIAYAVTFLQTDPFYVIGLADPAAPTVLGEVELPGFSSYLHPVADGLVAGFGPDGEGKASVKLFDVSDPAAPAVVDSLTLGDESAVTWDHHAFVDLDGARFAVPASAWRESFPDRCTAALQEDARARQAEIEAALAGPDGSYVIPDDVAEGLYEEMDDLAAEGCLYPGAVTDSSVVVIDAAGGELTEVERHTTEMPEGASRAIPAGDGWALLGGTNLTLLDGSGDVRVTLALS